MHVYPQKKSNKKVIAGLTACLVLGFMLYDYISQPVRAVDELVLEEQEGVISKNLLVVLDRIESIKLDEKFFENAAFLSLQDFSVVLTPEPTGRPNPFAPIGSGAQTTTGSRPRR